MNDPKVNYIRGLGEEKVWHEPCWTMMQLTHLKVAQPKPGALQPQVCLYWTVQSIPTVPLQRGMTSPTSILDMTLNFRELGILFHCLAQLARAAENIDCISAEG